ncbi:MAG: putative RNA-binding protein with TRAM domain [Myxococcota bacterium]|jgi:predicted RNA-binding protein with TRAM domain
MNRSILLGLALATFGGCDVVKDALPSVNITGKIQVDGDMPSDFAFELYSVSQNPDAFDVSFCGDNAGPDCFGRVKVPKLNSAAKIGEVKVNGSNFELLDVPADIAYVLVVTGADGAISCSTDILGFDPQTKVVTADAAISFDLEGDLGDFDAGTARIKCFAPATEPEPPADPEPVEEPEPDAVDDDNDIKPPAVPAWSTFMATSKGGGTVFADASDGPAQADAPCGADFPSIVEVTGDVENASDRAFIRIQFGTGDDADFRTVETPIVDGNVNQAISLTGGYSIVQLDTDATLDGVGESNTITFCEKGDAPGQEMLVILTWDSDDTDVDMHVYSNASEVAYYSLSQAWGDLDIDDVNGFGPETFTSTPETVGKQYEVKVHYYSDHGNGPTNVTARVVYWDDSTGQTCDVTSTFSMSSYDWFDVGAFGPGMPCPQ